MTPTTSTTCCCNCAHTKQNEEVVQQLTKRLDEMEQRMNQLYRNFDSWGNNCILTHAEANGTGLECQLMTTEVNDDDDDEENVTPPPSFLQSRRLLGLKGTPRYTFSVPSTYGKKLNLAPELRSDLNPFPGKDEQGQENGSHQSSSSWESPELAAINRSPVSSSEKRREKRACENTKDAKTVRFVSSTAKQVRFSHLESETRMAPILHTEEPIVYDRDSGMTGDEKECGGSAAAKGGKRVKVNSKPGTSKDNAAPLRLHPVEPLDEH